MIWVVLKYNLNKQEHRERHRYKALINTVFKNLKQCISVPLSVHLCVPGKCMGNDKRFQVSGSRFLKKETGTQRGTDLSN
jgi:hypothetical protein